MIQLRDYQTETVSRVHEAIHSDATDSLVVLPTGSGKTITFSEILRQHHMNGSSDHRSIVLIHRRDLVQQTVDKLRMVWPEAPVGVACGTLDEEVDITQPITVGTVQTLHRRLDDMLPLDLAIIDEAHRLTPQGEGRQYQDVLTRAREINPEMHLLGFTATPYRSREGAIYDCEGSTRDNWFKRSPIVEYSISDIQQLGYLCPVRALVPRTGAAELVRDLRDVHRVAGEYNLGELSGVMRREIHLESAVRAYDQHGRGRTPALVFCVDIEHATLVADAFKDAGHCAAAVHSQMPLKDRDSIIADVRAGKLDILVNVGVLTEGFDLPECKLILLCRPTLSPGLYVQMVGRGTRIAQGKTDCLVIDLAGNVRRHGHWSAPRLAEHLTRETVDVKECPACGEVLPLATVACPECGHEFFEKKAAPSKSQDAALPELEEFVSDHEFPVDVVRYGTKFKRTTGNNESLLLWAETSSQAGDKVMLFESMLFGHFSAKYFASRKWEALAGTKPPRSVAEAVSRAGEIKVPKRLWLRRNQRGFHEILLDRTVDGWAVRNA